MSKLSEVFSEVNRAVDEYIEEYELYADSGVYTPNDTERFLIEDCVAGLLAVRYANELQ